MRNRVIGVVIMVAALQLIGAQAHAAIIISAEENGGTNNQPAFAQLFAQDTTAPPNTPRTSICRADENLTACMGTQMVPAAMVTGAAGAVVQVDLCNVLPMGNNCALPSVNPATQISDQLYLTVGATAGGMTTLNWCWDSDRELSLGGTPVICPAVDGVPHNTVLEPDSGFVNPPLTNFFVAPLGPLAAGQWIIQAESELPEPATIALLGVGLLGMGAAYRRFRK
jgi:hypothetical protein